MVRLVNIWLPLDKAPLTVPRIQSLAKDYIFQYNSFETQTQVHISFKAKDKHMQYVLEKIQKTGCGVYFGQVDVLSLVLSKPPLADPFSDHQESSGKKKRAYRISDRMTVDEIAACVDDGNHLTFNYIAQLAMASLIAGAGLLGDSATTVIASMLVSPLMGPILSITFGWTVHDRRTVLKGLRNEFAGICISMLTGLLMGAIASFFYTSDYRSGEMTGRGKAGNLFLGFVVAFASGIAVVVAISMGGVNAIVGTAISASLLPPIVNSGLCLSMAAKYALEGFAEDAHSYAIFGLVSFSLFLLNFVVIVLVGFITFRYVKDVKPQDKMTDQQRYFSESSVNGAAAMSALHSSPSITSDVSLDDDLNENRAMSMKLSTLGVTTKGDEQV